MFLYNRLALLITTLLMVAQSFDVASKEMPQMRERTDHHLVEWSQGNKHFTSTFYSYAKDSGFNFVFSPLSLQIALAMASELACGETQNEMVHVSYLPEDANLRQQGAKKILEQLNTGGAIGTEPVHLALANSSWLSSEMIFKQQVETVLANAYQAKLNLADFVYSAEQTRQEINAWVEANTFFKIQNFMPDGTVTRQTKLVLVNTLYMRAPWASAFDPLMTYDDVFYGLEKSLRPIPFMRKIQVFNTLNEEDYTVVELPFMKALSTKAELALYVVLPHENIALNAIEDGLTMRRLAHWIADANPQYTDLSLPKFKLSSSIPAKEVLKKMGLKRPFKQGAEFELEGQDSGLVVSDIFHQATFEVDEWGGVGSAATGVGFTKTSYIKRPPPTPIVVNRPFLVVVADKSTGMILFSGRVMQPNMD